MNSILRRRRAMMGCKTDPYTWEELFKSIDAGTYATKYALGDLIPLDLGTGGKLNMQIVGFDKDTISGSSDNAPVTLISKELYKDSKRYNPAYSAGTVGTGTIGGWHESELRSFMLDTIFPMIPSFVAQRIVTVSKVTNQYDSSGNQQRSYYSAENLWIPSFRELTGRSDREQSGVGRYPYFAYDLSASATRAKSKAGGSAMIWWTRTAGTTDKEYYVAADGSVPSFKVVTSSYGFPVCFCVG